MIAYADPLGKSLGSILGALAHRPCGTDPQAAFRNTSALHEVWMEFIGCRWGSQYIRVVWGPGNIGIQGLASRDMGGNG